VTAEILHNDLRFDFYDNASPGDSFRVTCRIVHIPTGKVGQSDDQRGVLAAKRQAFARLLRQLPE
jgi:protein subunit release factor A